MTLIVPAELFPTDKAPAPEQVAAVHAAAESTVQVITGGPGVGKTFTINAILKLFDANGIGVTLLAPTGKAAQRIKEQTGRQASTIHRLLGTLFDVGDMLPRGAYVVDEMSMVDAALLCALITKIPNGSRLVLAGDVDQLPSIGPGRVLFDIIQSGVYPVTRLTRIFRQASESRIPYVARDINEGRTPDLSDRTGDVLWAEVDEAEEVADAIVNAYTHRLPARGFRDIQVLAPQRSGACGVEALNQRLQAASNSNAANRDALVAIGNGYKCAEGDRVIHTENNYDLMTFNGEIGRVVAASWQGLDSIGDAVWAGKDKGRAPKSTSAYQVIVDYGDRKVAYSKEELDQLQLAYAITIHKSQGSQFECVIQPVVGEHTFMNTRPLVYTGLTRAAKLWLGLGQEKTLAGASTNIRGVARRTALQERIAAAG